MDHMIGSKSAAWMRAREVASVIRLRPFDTSSSEGRSLERLRRVALTALTAGGSQGVSMLVTLITVPLTLSYLGAERYGLWVTLSSIIAFLGFADLGMGNGLLNAVSEANGKDDRRLAQAYVSSAFFMLCSVAVFLALAWVIVYPHLSWTWFFNLSSAQAQVEAGPAITVFVVCFLANIPLGITQKIQMGYQEGFVTNLWQGLAGLLGLICVLAAIALRAGLPWLVFAMTGVPLLTTAMNGATYLMRRKWLLPRRHAFNSVAARRIFRTGLLFFVLQLAVALGFQSDNIVIARLFGADMVTQYAIPMKLFMLVPMLVTFVLTPLWPAYGEAITRRDLPWVRRIFQRSLTGSFVLNLIPAGLLVLFGQQIIQLWTKSAVDPSFGLLLGMGIWAVLNGVARPIAMFLNGANVVGFQVVCALLMGVSNLLLSIFLVQRIGISGPVYGSIIAWTLFSLIPLVVYIPRLFARWRAEEQASLRSA